MFPHISHAICKHLHFLALFKLRNRIKITGAQRRATSRCFIFFVAALYLLPLHFVAILLLFCRRFIFLLPHYYLVASSYFCCLFIFLSWLYFFVAVSFFSSHFIFLLSLPYFFCRHFFQSSAALLANTTREGHQREGRTSLWLIMASSNRSEQEVQIIVIAFKRRVGLMKHWLKNAYITNFVLICLGKDNFSYTRRR